MSEVRDLINTIVEAHNRLRQIGVMRSQKFQADFGEWLVETFFDGIRSPNPVQKHWDIVIDDRKVQVKTHAKSDKNHNGRTEIKCDENTNFDVLFIIVLSQDFYIKDIYQIPKQDVIENLDANNKVSWINLDKFKVPNNDLLANEGIRPFLFNHDVLTL